MFMRHAVCKDAPRDALFIARVSFSAALTFSITYATKAVAFFVWIFLIPNFPFLVHTQITFAVPLLPSLVALDARLIASGPKP